jgi:hypothetical protein
VHLGDYESVLTLWEEAERYLGVGTRDFSRFASDMEVSPQYLPQAETGSFELESFWVEPDAGEYLTVDPSSTLHSLYRDATALLLPVHPDTLEQELRAGNRKLLAMPKGPSLSVAPLANVRTVLVKRIGGRVVTPHFLKLHYPRRVSRFKRLMTDLDVRHELWCAKEFRRVRAPVLTDIGGGIFDGDGGRWGYIVREARLFAPQVFEWTVPLFALYGRDGRAMHDATLLEQLVEASGAAVTEFLAEKIVVPMLKVWCDIALRTGCMIEMHGQNTLFNFSTACRASQIGYRDGGIFVDAELRRRLDLPNDLPPIDVVPRDVGEPRDRIWSLVLDSFMGHHALSALNRYASAFFGFDRSLLPAVARNAFREVVTDDIELPATVFYYDDQLHPDNGWHLVDTGQRPVWR